MHVLRIAVMITLSAVFLLASACGGFVFIAGGGPVALMVGVLFFLIFLALLRELLKGDT